MEAEFQQPKRREAVISALNGAVGAMNLAEKISSIAPAKAAFGSVGTLLVLIRDSMVDEVDHVELGLLCADICRVLDRGTNGKKLDELSQSVCDAINLLTLTVAEIQRRLVKWGKRNAVSRRFHAKNDKETIGNWKLDLDRVLQLFNKELVTNRNATVSTIHHGAVKTDAIGSDIRKNVVNTPAIFSDIRRNTLKIPEDTRGQNLRTHASAPGELPPPLPTRMPGTISDIRDGITKTHAVVSEVQRDVADIRRNVLKSREGIDGQRRSAQTSTLGESPPPAPRVCFGRDELIEEIVGLAENLTPVALIGTGGIGKTSIALTVLHHDRIKQLFGDSRRFIRCDQFPPSCAHFLSRLSNVIGTGIENPEDLASLRPFLSSREILMVLDNAESILDPRGTDAQEIYAAVEELSQLRNVCLCITSRISTIPSDCKTFDIPTLSVEAAQNAFYRIYKNGERPDLAENILGQLDFHPLSITLLATVGHHNKWDMDRLTKEWETRRTRVLQTEHNRSLAATIELSLASPMFRELGPDAREFLGAVAFFPQGVDETNLKWLFPTIPNGQNIFDKFCILSLTYRSNGFATMLAPLRDYLSPKDPKSSPLLCAAKEHYFTRISVVIDPDKSNFEESQWIRSEDINVEHLLDVFSTIDANSDSVWVACAYFMQHLFWHKGRITTLGAKIEGLSDEHHRKSECLFELSRFFSSVGNNVKSKQLLSHMLKREREQGNYNRVAQMLWTLSDANRLIGLHREGIQQAEEALEIYERLGDTKGQSQCWISLASLLRNDERLDAAEEAAFRAIGFIPEECSNQACKLHRTLGEIYQSKGETEKAVHHFEIALEIASPFNWHNDLFWVHYRLAGLFGSEHRLHDANAHIQRAKSHTINNAYHLGCAMDMQALVWYGQYRVEEARSEALGAVDIFEKLGAVKELDGCRQLLWGIEEEINGPATLYSDASRGAEDTGSRQIAHLSRYIPVFRRFLRETVVQCRLGRLGMDVYLIAGFSLLVPLILPSQYAPSLPIKLLYLCIVLFLVFPHC